MQVTLHGFAGPDEIQVYPGLNPRGAIHDTTDLQDSIRKVGRILIPLLVRLDDQGRMWLIDGARRLTAARAMRLDSVPYLIVDAAESEVLDLMLVSNVRREFPPVVLDKSGEVVGGLVKAIVTRLGRGDITMQELARVMGLRPDAVSAYVQLAHAPVSVRRAVADGRLSMTAFARMKHAPADVQAATVADGDETPVTVERVRRILRQAASDETAVVEPDMTDVLLEQVGALVRALRQLRGPIDPRLESSLDTLRGVIERVVERSG